MPQSCLNCKKKVYIKFNQNKSQRSEALDEDIHVGIEDNHNKRLKAGNTLNRIYTEKGNGEFVESHKVSTQKPFMSKFVTRKGRGQKKGNHKTEEHKKNYSHL